MKAGVSMKTNDYVKYITQTVIKYIDQPKDDRKRIRAEKKRKERDIFISLVWYFAIRLFGKN